MKKKICMTLAMLLSLAAFGERKTVGSPDGKLLVTIDDEQGKATYAIRYEDRTILLPSALGLKADYANFTEGLKIVASRQQTIHEPYEMTHTKRAAVDYKANEMVLSFENKERQTMEVTFRVSNHDVAYRYTLLRPKKDVPRCAVVYGEASGFCFPNETRTFLSPQITPMTGWERTKPSYEEEYQVDKKLTDPSQYGVGYTFPCLFRLPQEGKKDAWVLVSETGTGVYPGCRLSEYDATEGYHIDYPQPGESNGEGSTHATFSLPGSTPWRTITVGTSLKPIVETTVAYDLVKPLYAPTTSYKAGRYTWSWIIWMDESCNYDDQVKFIDVASQMGYEYILVDAHWDTQIGYDRVEALARYAKAKNVELMLWYNSNGANNDAPQGPRDVMNNSITRKRDLQWMKKIGVKAIKVDFFGSDKQSTMQLYQDILSDANDYGIQVIFHGCTLPRGWERMYPNYVASEAALASENVYFTDYHAKKEAFELTMYPFTRNTVAAFDWGGVLMNRWMSKDNKSRHQRFTGDIFEMATAITNQCSVNCVALTPEALAVLPSFEIEWLKKVPTTWKDLQFIDGYPGRYFAVARLSTADKWYAAALNAEDKAVTKTLSLPMFAGKMVRVYVDKVGKKGERWPQPTMQTMRIGKDGKLKMSIAPRGGLIVEEA